MNLKEFIERFDFSNPDWSGLPEHFFEIDLPSLTSEEIGKFNAIKSLWKLAQPEKSMQGSRTWSDPEGYRHLVPWSNAVLLRYLIRLHTESLPKAEYRRKTQVDDAARSVVRNIEEGYKRATTKEYIDFIGYSQGSLEEVKGDVREMTEDGFLNTKEGSGLAGIGLDLGQFHNALKDGKGELRMIKVGEMKDFTYRPLTILYPPLNNVRAEDLTYEIFLELINKTDWLLRGLVVSLEMKLGEDRKGYQITQAKIQDSFRK